ncbi:hypothetical protein CHS0354_025028, partial [Potamilus streckersoni]
MSHVNLYVCNTPAFHFTVVKGISINTNLSIACLLHRVPSVYSQNDGVRLSTHGNRRLLSSQIRLMDKENVSPKNG